LHKCSVAFYMLVLIFYRRKGLAFHMPASTSLKGGRERRKRGIMQG
jgi:hypothetical protein